MDPRTRDKMAYTVEQDAGLLSLSRTNVYRLLDLGELDSVQIGRSRRVTTGQLEAFVRRLEGRAAAPTEHRK